MYINLAFSPAPDDTVSNLYKVCADFIVVLVKTTPVELKNSPLKTHFYSHTIPPRVLKKKSTLTWFS
jgi:hypothetical protein